MKKINLKGVSGSLNTLKSFVTANSPVLLVGAAVTGVVTTGVLAAKAGYEARGRVDERENEEGRELTLQEKATLTAPLYVAPVIAAGTSVAAVVGVHTIHNKRHAALAGLYAMATSRLDEVQTKAEEMLGAKKNQSLQNNVAQSIVDANGFENSEVIMTGNGDELCFDSTSGRWFASSITKIEGAVNNLNEMIIHDGHASLNDFYDTVGLPRIPLGEDVGWSGKQMEVGFDGVVAPDNRPAVLIRFRHNPETGYDRRERC